MEKVSSILADFRLNFGDDQKRHVMTSREKCSKSIELVDSLLLCSQQQIDQFLSPSLDSLFSRFHVAILVVTHIHLEPALGDIRTILTWFRTYEFRPVL